MATRMSLYLDDGDVIVYHADCVEAMRAMPAASIDAIITDPPYGLEFMGKDWDRPWRKGGETSPGALATGEDWNGRSRPRQGSAYPRSAHKRCRTCGRQDFSGSPCECATPEWEGIASEPTQMRAFQAWCESWAVEALRVLKPGGHLAAFGGTRTAHRLASGIEDAGFEIRDTLAWLYGSGFPKSLDVSKAIDKANGHERRGYVDTRNGPNTKPGTKGDKYSEGFENEPAAPEPPATPDAERWQGWGTALKPAHEPITLARKPLRGTVAANVLEHATGALNIDACRIGAADGDYAHPGNDLEAGAKGFGFGRTGQQVEPHAEGRWPANVILDAEAAAILDQQTGESASTIGKPRGAASGNGWGMTHTGSEYADRGGASRFFYTAKASGSERNDGLEDRNGHPTVKPVDLMRWLIRLLAPPHALILDPFAGSGTTGVAARLENTRCILIEREAEYLPIIAGRLSQQSLLS